MKEPLWYKERAASDIWDESRNIARIQLPSGEKISPYELRRRAHGQPCECCGVKMVQGQFFIEDEDKLPSNYVTLDHKLPKYLHPKLMFDYSNLQLLCHRCNQAKSSSYTYDLREKRQRRDKELLL